MNYVWFVFTKGVSNLHSGITKLCLCLPKFNHRPLFSVLFFFFFGDRWQKLYIKDGKLPTLNEHKTRYKSLILYNKQRKPLHTISNQRNIHIHPLLCRSIHHRIGWPPQILINLTWPWKSRDLISKKRKLNLQELSLNSPWRRSRRALEESL